MDTNSAKSLQKVYSPHLYVASWGQSCLVWYTRDDHETHEAYVEHTPRHRGLHAFLLGDAQLHLVRQRPSEPAGLPTLRAFTHHTDLASYRRLSQLSRSQGPQGDPARVFRIVL